MEKKIKKTSKIQIKYQILPMEKKIKEGIKEWFRM